MFGERSLDAVGYTRLANRSKVHRSCLEKWEKDRTPLDADVCAKVIEMLDDALEMSRCVMFWDSCSLLLTWVLTWV